MASRRQIQVSELFTKLAGEFFARESNGTSLITVTHADVSPDLRNVKIYFSVLPESYEKPALNFAKRSRTEFREYIKDHARLQYLPNVDFEIDLGEKNRQLIDNLTRK
ncbi:MAG TPA: ribosome-binding factor A [Candidatus Paceibacterota bacterium]|nr:ribosome-binding factor A [Candidatus Paceibacterota bacterium]